MARMILKLEAGNGVGQIYFTEETIPLARACVAQIMSHRSMPPIHWDSYDLKFDTNKMDGITKFTVEFIDD